MKQFYHQETEYAGSCGSSVNRFQYKGKDVLLVGSSEQILVVAGFISGEFARQKAGFKTATTDVEPITDDTQKEELSDLLREKMTNKEVVFWGN